MRIPISYIYFMQNTANNYIKIGFSRNPVGRLSSLQTGSTDKLILLSRFDVPGPLAGSVERMLHMNWQGDRIGETEWFKPNPILLRFALDEGFRVGTDLWAHCLLMIQEWENKLNRDRIIYDTTFPTSPILVESVVLLHIEDVNKKKARYVTVKVSHADGNEDDWNILCLPPGCQKILATEWEKNGKDGLDDNWIVTACQVLNLTGIGDYYYIPPP